MHGMEMGMAGFHSQIKLYGESGCLSALITALIDLGFEIYICSDHGNIECEGKGRPKEASIAQSRGERVRVYKTENLTQSITDQFNWSAAWKPLGLPKEYYPLVAKGTGAFLPENTRAISHGGISFTETIVPFVQVARK